MVIDFQDFKKADFNKMLEIWGNGNELLGYSLFYAVTMRLYHARVKHPKFANSEIHSFDVIKSELDELEYAIKSETENRQFDEALDVIATALRFANKEYKKDL